MCGGSAKQKTSSTSTYTPNSTVGNAVTGAIGNAQDLTQTPFNYDTTKQVAGFNPQQTAAFNQIGAMQGVYAPYLDAASGYTGASAQPISGSAIQNYMNPYQQQVMDATLANIGKNNAIQQNQLKGNAIAQGALGGNRMGVAQAELARNQDLNTNQTIANLMSSGYNSALGAAQQDAGRQMQAGTQMANLGSMAQGLGLQGIQALLGAGNQQQAQAQGMYDAASGNQQAATMWPYQNQQWAASILGALGPLMGGTTTGNSTSTTKQNPGLGNMIGGGLSLLSMLKDGGAVGYADGGSTFAGMPAGGFMPWTQLGAAKPIIPELPNVSPPQAAAQGMPDPKSAVNLGQSARRGIDNVLRGLDPAKGWGAETVPTANLGAPAAGGGFLSGLGSMTGFADGGPTPLPLPAPPKLAGSSYLAAPGSSPGAAPASYFADAATRLARSQGPATPAAVPVAPTQPTPVAGNGGKGSLNGWLSSILGGFRGAEGMGGIADRLKQLGTSGHFADGGGIFDDFFGPGLGLTVSGSAPEAPPLSDFSGGFNVPMPQQKPAMGSAPAPEAGGFMIEGPLQTQNLGMIGDRPRPGTGELSNADMGMDAYKRAIASIESAGHKNPYTAIGPKTRSGDRALGKYQVMGENVPAWTEKHVGRRMSTSEFLRDADAQEKVFEGEFGGYLQKYGNPDDAASMWFSGKPAKQAAGRNDGYTSQPEYLRRFNASLGGDGGPMMAENAARTVARRADGPSNAQGLVAKGMDPEQEPAKRYTGELDKVGGGLLQRFFGIEFNPLRLDKEERTALLTAGLSMMSNGDIGAGGLAGLQSLQKAEAGKRDAAMEAQKLHLSMMKERKLTEIGKDPLTGDPIMGWVDPFTMKVTPMNGASAGTTSPAAGGLAGSGGSSAPVTAPLPVAQGTAPSAVSGAPGPSGSVPAAMPAKQPLGSIPEGFRELDINPARLREPAKGYIYELSPNGKPIADAHGNPKQILQKDAEAKSKLSGGQSDDAYKLQDAVSGIDDTFKLANELIHHPGTERIAGTPLAGEAQVKGVGVSVADLKPGTADADAFNKHKTLVSNVVLRTMEKLKATSSQGATGFGALSGSELKVLQDSSGNLILSSSYPEVIKNYKKFQKDLLKIRDRMITRYRDRYGSEPEGLPSRQELLDAATESVFEQSKQPMARPRNIPLPFTDTTVDIPFTTTTDPIR